MRKLSVLILFNLIVLSSCVYFNTFYNAEQGFKRAERNQQAAAVSRQQQATTAVPRAAVPQEPTSSQTDKALYKEAIDRANKVATQNPNSKYVNDALWLIGKSRYNMSEYVSADKKLRELVTKFPNSKYFDDAYFYIGMSQFWQKKYDLALEAFTRITDKKSSSYKDDAAFMIAYMDYVQANFNSSLLSFEEYLKNYPKSDSAASAKFFEAVSLDSLKQFDKALNSYRGVEKYKPDRSLYFDARFAMGDAAFKADSFQLGMAVFADLAKQQRYFTKSSTIRLRLAEGKNLLGQTDESIAEYKKIIEQFPSTQESAEAYYRLGLIYQNKNDYVKAKECFNKSPLESANSPVRNLALAHIAQISKLETYMSKLGEKLSGSTDSSSTSKQDSLKQGAAENIALKQDTLSKQSDSLIVKNISPDSIAVAMAESAMTTNDTVSRAVTDTSIKTAPIISGQDSLIVSDSLSKSAVIDSANLADTIRADTSGKTTPDIPAATLDTTKHDEDISTRFLLAELYYRDLNRPDSALNEYMLLAENYPESPYASKALLAVAFIYEEQGDTSAATSVYNRIINSYPSSLQAKFAAQKLGLTSAIADKDISKLYGEAEDLYFKENNADSAISLFTYIESAFPSSEFAAQSAFARAWIIDQTLSADGDSAAYYAYDELVKKYPETTYAIEAKRKLGLLKDTTSTKTIELPVAALLDSAAQDSLDRARQDSIAALAMAIPMAPPVKDTGLFLYPESLIRTKRTGRVTFKIKLDLFGKVADYQILGPSGQAEIDSAAIKALMSTTFDMSSFSDLSHLNNYYRYEIKFAPPKLDEFYNPYQEGRERGP